jgi:hypothetical protein
MKDGFIAKLKYDLKERNEDVNVLVPEVNASVLISIILCSSSVPC